MHFCPKVVFVLNMCTRYACPMYFIELFSVSVCRIHVNTVVSTKHSLAIVN